MAVTIMWKHAIHGRDLKWSVVSSIVRSIGPEKSILMKFVVTVLSHTDINRDSRDQKKSLY